ncbi:MAG: hypothetical protein ACPGRC_11205 [Salibacteraceae bacterium]
MKKFASIIFVLIGTNCYSQLLELGGNLTGAGKNITATYSFLKGNHEFGAGLGYNLNSIKQSDDQNQIYYQRLFATKSIHHLNVELFYNRYIFDQLEHIRPFIFVDIQAKYSTTRSSMYLPHSMDTSISGGADQQILYVNVVENFGPFLWIENYIGAGFRVNLFNKLHLRQRVGFGGYSVIGHDDRLGGNYTWEFAGIFSLGVVYEFMK